MNYLGGANEKYRARYGNALRIFGLPAYRSTAGKLVCRGSGECVHGCYARQGWYRQIKQVAVVRERNLELAMTTRFVPTLDREIRRATSIRFIRIHDSGDFFSDAYFKKWLALARKHPWIIFFAYTKVIPTVRRFQAKGMIPDNMKLVFSEGGRWDHLITEHDRFTRIFPTSVAMLGTGFFNASTGDDLEYLRNGGRRLGLVYHGKAKRWFSTDGQCPTLLKVPRS